MKKKLLSLALLSAAWLACGSAQAWDKPAQVDGVYQIGTVSELEWFAEAVNGGQTTLDAVLTADLDFDGVDYIPIGSSDTNKYQGHFNGQGHKISNLYIDKGSSDNVGFFTYLRGGTSSDPTIVENLIIDETCSFKGGNRVGALCGNAKNGDDLIIRNCVNMANVTAVKTCGAFVGAAQGNNYAKIMVTNSTLALG